MSLREFFGRIFQRGPGPELTVIESGEASVAAATAQARAQLDVFWRKFESGEADEYQLKVGLTTPNEATEHVWLTPQSWSDGKVIGRLLSQPADLDDINLGDEIAVDPEHISDWAYFKGGKLYGAFTQRALLDRVSPAMRRQLLDVLAPTPLEPDHH